MPIEELSFSMNLHDNSLNEAVVLLPTLEYYQRTGQIHLETRLKVFSFILSIGLRKSPKSAWLEDKITLQVLKISCWTTR